MSANVEIKSKCHTCPMRERAKQNPRSFLSRLWRWHTGWCPGWKAYKKELAELGLPAPEA